MIPAATPIAAEIGAATVEHIEIQRARGKAAREIAANLNLDLYTVEEVFAWQELPRRRARGAARPRPPRPNAVVAHEEHRSRVVSLDVGDDSATR